MSKVIIATYEVRSYFKVPIEWELEHIYFKWNHLYYKGEEIVVPIFEGDIDMKRADKIEEADIDDYDGYFDCEDANEDEVEDEVKDEAEIMKNLTKLMMSKW
jgi:hypothetical protein